MSGNQLDNIAYAVFGAGCFWCVEAVFQLLEGVIAVESGYMGGKNANPTYHEVCSGMTGHAEVCKITYDSTKITYEELLLAFWSSHDPTTLNQQGADRGTQYRSVIFYANEHEKQVAEDCKQTLTAQGIFDKPIITEISLASTYYKAEDYHQNYFNRNTEAPYCQYVIAPKLKKFREGFSKK